MVDFKNIYICIYKPFRVRIHRLLHCICVLGKIPNTWEIHEISNSRTWIFIQSGFENLSGLAFLLASGVVNHRSLILVIAMSLGPGFCASPMPICWSDHRWSAYCMITIDRSRVPISHMCLPPTWYVEDRQSGFSPLSAYFHTFTLVWCDFPL